MKRNTPLTVTAADGKVMAGTIELGTYKLAKSTKTGEERISDLALVPAEYVLALSDGTVEDKVEVQWELLDLLLNKSARKDANNNPSNGPEAKLASVLSSAFDLLTPLSDDDKLAKLTELKAAILAAKKAGNVELAMTLQAEFLDLV